MCMATASFTQACSCRALRPRTCRQWPAPLARDKYHSRHRHRHAL